MTGLPESVEQALTALKAGAWVQARAQVEHALAQVQDPGLLARLHGWHAQALCELGEFDSARTAVRQALLAARDLQDTADLAPLRALHGRITGGLAAQAATEQRLAHALALAARPLKELLAAAEDPVARAGVYLARADALVDAGRADEVPALVHAGLQEAPREAVREQVLLRLAHLRVHPPHAEEILAKALEAAQDADNHTLIGAVARAARLLGLALPEQTF